MAACSAVDATSVTHAVGAARQGRTNIATGTAVEPVPVEVGAKAIAYGSARALAVGALATGAIRG